MAPASIQFSSVRTAAQIEALCTLAREIWTEFYVPLIGLDQVNYMLDKFQSESAVNRQLAEGYDYFLVLSEGRPIGYLGLQAQHDRGALFISKFYLRRTARGSGTGRVCMEFIGQLARERGLGLLWLTVNKGNPSVDVYLRLGFRISAEIVMDIGSGFVMDDYRMEKALQ